MHSRRELDIGDLQPASGMAGRGARGSVRARTWDIVWMRGVGNSGLWEEEGVERRGVDGANT